MGAEGGRGGDLGALQQRHPEVGPERVHVQPAAATPAVTPRYRHPLVAARPDRGSLACRKHAPPAPVRACRRCERSSSGRGVGRLGGGTCDFRGAR